MDRLTKEKTVLHPYIAASIPLVEKWLEDSAANGWKLKAMNGWRFTFQKGQSMPRRYFLYTGFDAETGFSNIYFRANEKYALRSSALKKNSNIFEVDPRKEDEELRTCYRQRNRYYRRKYAGLTVLLAVFEAVGCVLARSWGAPILSILLILPLLYFAVGWLMLVVLG